MTVNKKPVLLFNMSISWIVQDNLGSTSSTADSLKRACVEEGQEYVPIQIIPFSNDLPIMPDINGKFVFYGRTTLILNAFEDPKWRSGVYFDPNLFTPQHYLENWGNMMLNHDAQFITINDIPNLNYSPSDKLFMRPDDDLKRLSSGVVDYYDLMQIYANSTNDKSEFVNLSTRIVVSLVKEIPREWRLFIVDGRFVTGSQYYPKVSSFVPQEVIEFAENAAKIWTPSSIFVLDIAREKDELKIIECNCFNGSGFYESDLNQLVRVVSKYVEMN